MKILMILSKEFMTDPRVYKEAMTLTQRTNHDIRVIYWDRKNQHKSDADITIAVKNTFFMRLLPGALLKNPFWWKQAYKQAVRLYTSGFRFEAVHCHDLDTLLIGVWLKRKFNVKLVYDAHEIFGYMIQKTMPRIISRVAFMMEKNLIRNVDEIITVNQPLKNYFSTISDKTISIVMNCSPVVDTEYNPPNTPMFTVSYFGIFDDSRMFPEIIDYIGIIPRVRFVLAGKKEGLYDIVEQTAKKYDNVSFLGTISSNEVLAQTFNCDVVLCMLDPTNKNNQVGLPNKIFEAMMAGRPILTTAGTYSGEFVTNEHCGVAIDYNPSDVMHTIIQLRDDKERCMNMGKKGLYSAMRRYSWTKQEENLLWLYERLQR